MGNCKSSENVKLFKEVEQETIHEEKILSKKLNLRDIDEAVPFVQFQGKKEMKLNGIIDGDTLTGIVIQNMDGEDKPFMIKIRLLGCDTPEKTGTTADAGMKATESTYEFFGIKEEFKNHPKRASVNSRMRIARHNIICNVEFKTVVNISDGDKNGRMLASVFYKGKSLTEYHIKNGDANAYFGGTKDQSQWEKQ